MMSSCVCGKRLLVGKTEREVSFAVSFIIIVPFRAGVGWSAPLRPRPRARARRARAG
jgi:hypothetical protein